MLLPSLASWSGFQFYLVLTEKLKISSLLFAICCGTSNGVLSFLLMHVLVNGVSINHQDVSAELSQSCNYWWLQNSTSIVIHVYDYLLNLIQHNFFTICFFFQSTVHHMILLSLLEAAGNLFKHF